MATQSPYQEAFQLNRGPAVLMASWLLIGLSAVFVIARGAARKKFLELESGDVLLPLALLLGLVQTMSVQFAVDNGLGRTYGTLGVQAVGIYHETMYWAQILYILVLGLTKTTLVSLIFPLQPPRPLRNACYMVGVVILMSTLAFVFATAFQCQLPHPWEVDNRRCINISALERALAITTITTDLLVTSLPLLAMVLLNLNQTSRIFICCLLSSRLVVPAFVLVQLLYLIKYDSSSDASYDGALIQIWTQVVLNVSIITACIPPLGCILSDIALGLVGRRMVPDTISWGRFSPPGISRIHLGYQDQMFQPLQATDKTPSFFNRRPSAEEGKPIYEKPKNSLSWFKLNPTLKANNPPEIQVLPERTKQVHFEDIPPLPERSPSGRYFNHNESTTHDVLSDYAENENETPPQFENPSMPPPAIPTTRSSALLRRPTSTRHKRSPSVTSSISQISEPSFRFASTMITPSATETGTGYRESTSFHRLTKSASSARPTSSIYSKRESFFLSHRVSRSLGALPFAKKRFSARWPGWFDRWEDKIEEETQSRLGSGSFVDVDQEFERCRTMYGRSNPTMREI